MIGTLLSIAACGRSSLQYLRQGSSFSAASARVMNQCWFKHLVRKRPLNASMKALSVGFPGVRSSEPHRADRSRGPCRARRTRCLGRPGSSLDSQLFGIPGRASRQRPRCGDSPRRGPAHSARRCRPRSEPRASCPWQVSFLHLKLRCGAAGG